jgi:general secretion pathway protein B
MSYILEALKKLEQKRQREGVPHPLAVPAETAPERRRQRLLWPYPFLAALLLLNAGIMLWWVGAKPEHRPAPVPPPPAREGTSVTPIAPAQTREEKRSVDVKEVPQKSETGTSPVPDVRKEVRDTSQPAAAKPPAKAETAPQPQTRTEKRAVADGRVLSLDELPTAVRSSLPELRVSAHYYSPEPQSRFIRINDQALREGQVSAPGLKLEEITPDGALFSYQGYRFKIGITGTR